MAWKWTFSLPTLVNKFRVDFSLLRSWARIFCNEASNSERCDRQSKNLIIAIELLYISLILSWKKEASWLDCWFFTILLSIDVTNQKFFFISFSIRRLSCDLVSILFYDFFWFFIHSPPVWVETWKKNLRWFFKISICVSVLRADSENHH